MLARSTLTWACAAMIGIYCTACGRDAPARSEAMDAKPGTFLARTNLGERLVWPDGFDATRIHGTLGYSPNGRWLAFELLSGDIGVLDLATGALRTFAGDYGPSNRTYGNPCWASPDALVVRENWYTPEQAAGLELDPPVISSGWAIRVVDVQDGATLLSRESIGPAPEVVVIGHVDGDQWLALQQGLPPKIRGYTLESDSLGEVLAMLPDSGQEEYLLSPWCAPWLLKVAGLLDEFGAPLPQGAPVQLQCTSVTTGVTKVVAGFPRPGPYGVLVSSDGTWVCSSYYDENGGSIPVVVNVDSGHRIDLPDESWVPVALSEVRGVLLVLLLTDPDGDGAWRGRSWYEVPLQSLLN